MYFSFDLNPQGVTRSLQQDGWQINYLDYVSATLDSSDPILLPRKLYMRHQQLALKIVIDQWQDESTPIVKGLFPEFDD